MIEFFILTLFPEMFSGVLSESILKRALEQQRVRIQVVNFRDFAQDKHKTVDDYPFGGGAGMLLKPQPLFDAVQAVKQIGEPLSASELARERVVLLSPQGRVYNQHVAEEYAQMRRIILLCGHYEGFDYRIHQHLVNDEISIGDFVMTGGEVAAMAVIDSVVRLLPGVLGNQDSLLSESHGGALLEYPQYTRPADFQGYTVPQTLLSGNHAEIEKWRMRHALYQTWKLRPDLLHNRKLSQLEKDAISKFENGDFFGIDIE